jgi:hypothetical protein
MDLRDHSYVASSTNIWDNFREVAKSHGRLISLFIVVESCPSLGDFLDEYVVAVYPFDGIFPKRLACYFE